ncbi:hypothetical protein EHS13_04085 [Paenibacillus psychroresistens]|uniref:Aldose 1-epimerase n=1 Tax=Paenibacillus psychroresistens TaxID=1778678 RepID=A0A6B8RF84_9BACL|nr:hypothetical protein [Paenibacillus psychroresistens]QGQ94142.1 hypothetical protein EHS13_04085 [Paenibacillus psychroresistens]
MVHSPIILENSRLRLEIAQPGLFYQGTRFDWTGWVTSVVLDGKHTYMASESLQPNEGTGGLGLCNEFGNLTPVGYSDCAIGEDFPKIGVGLLEKPDDARYNFFRAYGLQPFVVNVEQSDYSIFFEVSPLNSRGYECTLKKTISIKENGLSIQYILHNSGDKTIETDEYNHNFVLVNGNAVGPEYVLRLPFDVSESTAAIDNGILVDGDELRWSNPVDGKFYCLFNKLPVQSQNTWRLTHEPSGVGMQESLNAPLHHLALWGMPHVVSPEMFISILLSPGETMEWTREYSFFA